MQSARILWDFGLAYKSHRLIPLLWFQTNCDYSFSPSNCCSNGVLRTWPLESFFCETNNTVHMKWKELRNRQFLWPPPRVWKFLNEATIDSVLLSCTRVPSYTDRLLFSMLNMKTQDDALSRSPLEDMVRGLEGWIRLPLVLVRWLSSRDRTLIWKCLWITWTKGCCQLMRG